MERYVYLVLQTLVESSQQSTATTQVYTVLNNVGIKLGRGVLQGREHGVFYLCHGLVEAVGYLLIAYRHLHRQGGDAVRSVYHVVLGSLVAKVGKG